MKHDDTICRRNHAAVLRHDYTLLATASPPTQMSFSLPATFTAFLYSTCGAVFLAPCSGTTGAKGTSFCRDVASAHRRGIGGRAVSFHLLINMKKYFDKAALSSLASQLGKAQSFFSQPGAHCPSASHDFQNAVLFEHHMQTVLSFLHACVFADDFSFLFHEHLCCTSARRLQGKG
jgi:hypothetical protein